MEITETVTLEDLQTEEGEGMFQPKRTKYRRPHRVSYEGKAKGAVNIDFGKYALRALEGT